MDAEKFRDNLNRLMDDQGWTVDLLAKELQFDNEQRKWLLRLKRKGLQRIYAEKRAHLDSIARILGLPNIRYMWNDLTVVASREDAVRFIDRFRQRHPITWAAIVQQMAVESIQQELGRSDFGELHDQLVARGQELIAEESNATT